MNDNPSADTPDYLQLNLQSWNQRTPHHLGSAFYNLPAFLAGQNSLNDIEKNLLGDVAGKSLLHLQCHFGMDTLSLARMGAKVTGADLSDVSIAEAGKLASQCGLDADFRCCDLYSLPQQNLNPFDLVFTSYGTTGWLPDMDRWAEVIASHLKPGGRFVIADFHPVVWMYNASFTEIEFSYFNEGPIIEEVDGTYTDRNAGFSSTTVGWNHSLSEIMGALLSQGLKLLQFQEFDYSPYNCFAGMKEDSPGKWRIASLSKHIPFVYALEMEKPAI